MIQSFELGEQFNLRGMNLDAGGGLLYALRYSPEILELKMHSILDRLHEWGFEFIEFEEDCIGIQPMGGETVTEYSSIVPIMAEELSVISDARFYQSQGLGMSNPQSES